MYHVSRKFRHYLGEAPMGYLTGWRLQLAARLLRTGSSSVGEVAVKVGYDSQAVFNRAFKRQFGVPPARFRKACREGPAAVATGAGTAS